MSEDITMSPVLVKGWLQRAVFAFMIAVCTFGVILVASLVYQEYFNSPPITIQNLNQRHLGTLCPGQILEIKNNVTINDEIIVHYFISTMDIDSNVNYPGTQKAYTDFLHPHPSSFPQTLLWTVPELPSGDYARVFAVRKVSGNEDTVFVINHFKIGDDCNGTPSS